VFSALRHVFPSPAHVRLAGVRNGTGYARKRVRTIDALIFSTYPSRGLWMGGVEIKVSRSDWKKELADAEKAAEIQKYCNRWYVAAPAGVIPTAEVPDTWGHIECTAASAKIVKAAPGLKPIPPDVLLLCAIFRAFAEAHTPNAEVQNKVAEQAAEAEKRRQQNENYEVRALRESVDAFEKAAGISLRSRWDADNIGSAVKMILAVRAKGGTPNDIAMSLLRDAQRYHDQIGVLVARLQEELHNTEV
jgi:hypothetical protein